MSSRFVLRLFGALTLESADGRLTKFPTRRSALLLARLAIARDRRIGRDELAEILWPDDYHEQTRLRLRQELVRLRRSAGDFANCLLADRQWVEIQADALETDLERFDSALERSSGALTPEDQVMELRSAIGYVNGPLLSGFQEPWVLTLRRTYDDKARRAWLSLADALDRLGDGDGAVSAASQAVHQDPFDQTANASLMRLLLGRGQASRARQAFLEYDAMLFREFGRHAGAEIRSILEEPPMTESPRESPAVVPSGGGVDSRTDRLVPLSLPKADDWGEGSARVARPEGGADSRPDRVSRPAPVYGRADVLRTILAGLERPGARVVLVGAIGVGKSHIAREAAWEFGQSHDLPVRSNGGGEVVDDGLMLLDGEFPPEELIRTVEEASRNGWRVLAVSRRRLQASHLTEIVVHPLPTPGPKDGRDQIMGNPAVILLTSQLDRRVLERLDWPAVGTLARELDGLPAALQFFSRCLVTRTAEQILANLETLVAEFVTEANEGRVTVSTEVSDARRRLSPRAAEALARLAILGDASIELAETLLPLGGASDPWRELERDGLIVVEELTSGRRFRAPTSTRVALALDPPAEPSQRLTYEIWRAVAPWAFELSRKLIGSDQNESFRILESELPNLRRGLAWAAVYDCELGVLFAAGVWRTMAARGNPFQDGPLLLRTVRASHGPPAALLGEAWLGAAIVLSIAGRLDEAETAYLEAGRIFGLADYPDGQIWVDLNYAPNVLRKRDPRRAAEVSKQVADRTPSPGTRSLALSDFAISLAMAGDADEAIHVAERVFADRMQSDDITTRARAYSELGEVYQLAGRGDAARPLLEEGVKRLRDAAIQDLLLDALLVLSDAAIAEEGTGERLREATMIADRIGSDAKRLEIARLRLRWGMQRREIESTLASIEAMFRLSQESQSLIECRKSMGLLEDALRAYDRVEYANAVQASRGGESKVPIHAGWRALLRSDSPMTLCNLASVLAREALGNS